MDGLMREYKWAENCRMARRQILWAKTEQNRCKGMGDLVEINLWGTQTHMHRKA